MIVLLAKIVLILLLLANLAIGVSAHGKLIGYIVTKYKEGYTVKEPDGSLTVRPPQVLEGGWQRFDSTSVVISTGLYLAVLYLAGMFS